MSEQNMEVFASIIDSKVDDLASTTKPNEIKQIVDEAKTQTKEIVAKLDNPLAWDPVIYRVTVCVLGMVAIIVAIAQAVLAYGEPSSVNIPEGLVAIGAAAIGALAGLLAPTGGGKR